MVKIRGELVEEVDDHDAHRVRGESARPRPNERCTAVGCTLIRTPILYYYTIIGNVNNMAAKFIECSQCKQLDKLVILLL